MGAIQIIVASDNHGKREPIEKLHEMYPNAEYFFHLGDSEMAAYELHGWASVRGNNDYYGDLPMYLVIEAGSHNILLVHGHRDMYFGKYDMLAEKAKALKCDICCFGHTHVYTDLTIKGVRLLNPGSLRYNRDGTAPSYMILTIDGDEVKAERRDYVYS